MFIKQRYYYTLLEACGLTLCGKLKQVLWNTSSASFPLFYLHVSV